MDDAKIREEFDKWIRKDISFEDERFMKENESKGNVMTSCSFFAGYRLAERLCKIEVLEELKGKITKSGNWVSKEIDTIISELKAGQP
jgi:hypothetical protein